jgi:hypothetical protein
VVARGDAVALKAEHAKADVAVAGPASDILLWLWERLPVDGLTVHGDAGLLDGFAGMIDRD